MQEDKTAACAESDTDSDRTVIIEPNPRPPSRSKKRLSRYRCRGPGHKRRRLSARMLQLFGRSPERGEEATDVKPDLKGKHQEAIAESVLVSLAISVLENTNISTGGSSKRTSVDDEIKPASISKVEDLKNYIDIPISTITFKVKSDASDSDDTNNLLCNTKIKEENNVSHILTCTGNKSAGYSDEILNKAISSNVIKDRHAKSSKDENDDQCKNEVADYFRCLEGNDEGMFQCGDDNKSNTELVEQSVIVEKMSCIEDSKNTCDPTNATIHDFEIIVTSSMNSVSVKKEAIQVNTTTDTQRYLSTSKANDDNSQGEKLLSNNQPTIAPEISDKTLSKNGTDIVNSNHIESIRNEEGHELILPNEIKIGLLKSPQSNISPDHSCISKNNDIAKEHQSFQNNSEFQTQEQRSTVIDSFYRKSLQSGKCHTSLDLPDQHNIKNSKVPRLKLVSINELLTKPNEESLVKKSGDIASNLSSPHNTLSHSRISLQQDQASTLNLTSSISTSCQPDLNPQETTQINFTPNSMQAKYVSHHGASQINSLSNRTMDQHQQKKNIGHQDLNSISTSCQPDLNPQETTQINFTPNSMQAKYVSHHGSSQINSVSNRTTDHHQQKKNIGHQDTNQINSISNRTMDQYLEQNYASYQAANRINSVSNKTPDQSLQQHYLSHQDTIHVNYVSNRTMDQHLQQNYIHHQDNNQINSVSNKTPGQSFQQNYVSHQDTNQINSVSNRTTNQNLQQNFVRYQDTNQINSISNKTQDQCLQQNYVSTTASMEISKQTQCKPNNLNGHASSQKPDKPVTQTNIDKSLNNLINIVCVAYIDTKYYQYRKRSMRSFMPDDVDFDIQQQKCMALSYDIFCQNWNNCNPKPNLNYLLEKVPPLLKKILNKMYNVTEYQVKCVIRKMCEIHKNHSLYDVLQNTNMIKEKNSLNTSNASVSPKFHENYLSPNTNVENINQSPQYRLEKHNEHDIQSRHGIQTIDNTIVGQGHTYASHINNSVNQLKQINPPTTATLSNIGGNTSVESYNTRSRLYNRSKTVENSGYAIENSFQDVSNNPSQINLTGPELDEINSTLGVILSTTPNTYNTQLQKTHQATINPGYSMEYLSQRATNVNAPHKQLPELQPNQLNRMVGYTPSNVGVNNSRIPYNSQRPSQISKPFSNVNNADEPQINLSKLRSKRIHPMMRATTSNLVSSIDHSRVPCNTQSEIYQKRPTNKTMQNGGYSNQHNLQVCNSVNPQKNQTVMLPNQINAIANAPFPLYPGVNNSRVHQSWAYAQRQGVYSLRPCTENNQPVQMNTRMQDINQINSTIETPQIYPGVNNGVTPSFDNNILVNNTRTSKMNIGMQANQIDPTVVAPPLYPGINNVVRPTIGNNQLVNTPLINIRMQRNQINPTVETPLLYPRINNSGVPYNNQIGLHRELQINNVYAQQNIWSGMQPTQVNQMLPSKYPVVTNQPQSCVPQELQTANRVIGMEPNHTSSMAKVPQSNVSVTSQVIIQRSEISHGLSEQVHQHASNLSKDYPPADIHRQIPTSINHQYKKINTKRAPQSSAVEVEKHFSPSLCNQRIPSYANNFLNKKTLQNRYHIPPYKDSIQNVATVSDRCLLYHNSNDVSATDSTTPSNMRDEPENSIQANVRPVDTMQVNCQLPNQLRGKNNIDELIKATLILEGIENNPLSFESNILPTHDFAALDVYQRRADSTEVTSSVLEEEPMLEKDNDGDIVINDVIQSEHSDAIVNDSVVQIEDTITVIGCDLQKGGDIVDENIQTENSNAVVNESVVQIEHSSDNAIESNLQKGGDIVDEIIQTENSNSVVNESVVQIEDNSDTAIASNLQEGDIVDENIQTENSNTVINESVVQIEDISDTVIESDIQEDDSSGILSEAAVQKDVIIINDDDTDEDIVVSLSDNNKSDYNSDQENSDVDDISDEEVGDDEEFEDDLIIL